jgi:hypothetical protein
VLLLQTCMCQSICTQGSWLQDAAAELCCGIQSSSKGIGMPAAERPHVALQRLLP